MTSEHSSKYTIQSNTAKPQGLDPHLIDLVSRYKSGEEADPAFVHESSSGQSLVDVIAKVRDPQIEVPGFTVVTTMRNIVTGTISIDDIESVASNDNILKLEIGKKIYSDLHDSVREIAARPTDIDSVFPIGSDTPDGSDVIVGVVDFGCDFLHQNFRNNDGSSRILFFWDQNGSSSLQTPSPSPYGYGREVLAEHYQCSTRRGKSYSISAQ